MSTENLQTRAIEGGDAEAFTDLRKIMAAQLVGSGGVSASDAATMSDRGVFQAQKAYEAGQEGSSTPDIVEDLIDRNASHVSVWLSQHGAELCEKGGLAVGTAVGTYLAAWCPAALPVCQKIGQFCGKALGKVGTVLIDKGIKKITQCAKTLWQKAKETAGKIKEKIFSFFS